MKSSVHGFQEGATRAASSILKMALSGLLVAGILYGAHGGEYPITRIIALSNEKSFLLDSISYQNQRNEYSKKRLDLALYDSFEIERIARVRFGFLRDGEILIRLVDPGEMGEMAR